MNDDLDVLEAELGPRLRRTLTAVAGNAPEGAAAMSLEARVRGGRRVVAAGIACVVAVGFLAAWNAREPGEIERVPIETALMSGSAEGGRWWLLPSVHERCGVRRPGVEFVADATNKPGLEWNTGGAEYGEPSSSQYACEQQPDEASWMGEPARAALSYTRVGRERDDSAWGFYGAFHPTVAAIEVLVDNTKAFVVKTVPRAERPDGPRYAAFTVPPDARTVETRLLDADNRAIPGGTRLRTMAQ